MSALEKAAEIHASMPVVDGMEDLQIDSPTGPLTVHKGSHHVTLNMYLAKTEGAGLQTVEALGPQSPEAGCA